MIHLRIVSLAASIAAASMLLGPQAAADDALACVERYVLPLETMTAEFVQVVRDRDDQITDRTTGSLSFWRPNRFRWDYREPYEQTIVADGERLWLYDADLDQVTVRSLEAGLGSTPAMLLSGARSIADGFEGAGIDTVEGWRWCHLLPKDGNADFERVSMVFSPEGRLAGLVMYDKLGQNTRIDFTDLKRNPKLRESRFRFEPPEGADVIGDAGQ